MKAMSKTKPSAKEAWPKGVAQPAQRALAAAGYANVDQLANAREAELAALHGMGAKALDILRNALKQRGKSFRG
jgi:hypothetical protein